MKIDRAHILDFLRKRGDHDKAAQAEAELPDQVDTEQHGHILSRLDIDIENLGMGAGGIGG